jgi:hypothetical protein
MGGLLVTGWTLERIEKKDLPITGVIITGALLKRTHPMLGTSGHYPF